MLFRIKSKANTLAQFLFFTLLFGGSVYFTPVNAPKTFLHSTKDVITQAEIEPVNLELPLFLDRTLEAGLAFMHQQGGGNLSGIDDSLGTGGCAADFNSDGLVDLFLVNGSGFTRYYGKRSWWQTSEGHAYYLNLGNGSFRNATLESGIFDNNWGMGCLAADLDNDGNADLLITGKDRVLLYKNTGGRFIEIFNESGLTSQKWSTSSAAADFNNDGLLDIYIGQFIDFEKGGKTYEANSQFANTQNNTFDASLYSSLPNKLFLNQGDFKFKDVAFDVGALDSEGRSLDVAWQDINEDRFPDLLITNSKGAGSNKIYLNKNGEKFDTADRSYGLNNALGSRGIASGDLDKDGDLDLIVGSMPGDNTLVLMNNKIARVTQFQDKAKEVGIGANRYLHLSGWSPLIRDFNNDGYSDIMLVSGQLEPDPESPRVSLGQPKQLWLNDRAGNFIDVTEKSGVALLDTQSARGGITADFDNDGDIDVFVTHNNDLGQYLLNESKPSHWLGFKLVGVKSNRDAIGAIVRLYSDDGKQVMSVTSGEGFLSDSDKRIVFGLGETNSVEKVGVDWPSGLHQVFNVSGIDRYWLIVEGNDELAILPGTEPAKSTKSEMALKIGRENAELRIRYLKLIADDKSDPNILNELKAGIDDPDASVRFATIKIATQSNDKLGRDLLVHALEDDEPNNVVAAIAGLRGYEDESSIRWLLRNFRRNNSEIKIALAECFAKFFQEEEAVVHRKYLAIPDLIRLLDDSEPKVRIAAARALAEAERYRGVHALISHLSDGDVEVRAEIVRTLGLIRQSEVLPYLLSLLKQADLDPKVVSNLFIALKRLGVENASSRLFAYLEGKYEFEGVSVSRRVSMLAHLISETNEWTIFGGESLNQSIRQLFNASLSVADAEVKQHWFSIWLKYHDKLGLDWLMTQTDAKEPSERKRAYEALLNLNTSDADLLLHKALQDSSSQVSQWALMEILSRNLPLNARGREIVESDEELRQSLLSFIQEHGPVHQDYSILKLLRVNFPELGEQNSHSTICWNKNMGILNFCPFVLFANQDTESYRLAEQILLEPSQPESVRLALLEHLPLKVIPLFLNTLKELIHESHGRLRKAALQKILSVKSPVTTKLARNFAENSEEDPALRFLAAEFLWQVDNSAAKRLLTGGMDGKD